MTQVFLAIISVFAIVGTAPIVGPAFGGTLGTAEAETARLRDEVTAARNALDAEILKPGVKLTDPSVQAKRAELDEKVRAYQKGFQDALTAAPAKNSAPSANVAPPPAPAAPAEPQTVLSGEGIPNEITYSGAPTPEKTARPVPRVSSKTHAEEPVPENVAKPNAAGLSEIQYPKRKSGE